MEQKELSSLVNCVSSFGGAARYMVGDDADNCMPAFMRLDIKKELLGRRRQRRCQDFGDPIADREQILACGHSDHSVNPSEKVQKPNAEEFRPRMN